MARRGRLFERWCYTHPDEAVQFVISFGRDRLPLPSATPTALTIKANNTSTSNASSIKKALLDAGMGDYRWCCTARRAFPRTSAEEINKYGGKMGTDTGRRAGSGHRSRRPRRRCTKVNIDTDLRMARPPEPKSVCGEPKEFDPRNISAPPHEVKELVRHKVKTSSVAWTRL